MSTFRLPCAILLLFPKEKKATMANEWEHCDYEEHVMYSFRTHL